MHQVFIDDVAIEFLVPAVMQVLLFDQISDIYVAELRRLRQSGRCRRFAGSRSSCYQYIGLLPFVTILRHGYS